MASSPGEREAMRGDRRNTTGRRAPGRKTPGHPSHGGPCDDVAIAAAPEPQLPKPSWRWRLLLCAAIVCAVLAMTAAVMPELFLPSAQPTLSHAQP